MWAGEAAKHRQEGQGQNQSKSPQEIRLSLEGVWWPEEALMHPLPCFPGSTASCKSPALWQSQSSEGRPEGL